MTEREHCEAVACEARRLVFSSRARAARRAIADLIQRERAAAREQALEEAARLFDETRVALHREDAFIAEHFAEDAFMRIRALKGKP